MPSIKEQNNLGDLLKYEASNLYSRDLVSVVSGQNLELGAVVGIVFATGLVKRFDPSATDGSEHPAGVMLAGCDASLMARDDGLLAARHAIVASAALVWPVGITASEKSAAIATLNHLGVLVRQSA